LLRLKMDEKSQKIKKKLEKKRFLSDVMCSSHVHPFSNVTKLII
jgi:hypothetical protein